ncbi:MAG: ATP synthase subunit C [Eubacteriales bacterium]
MTVFYVVLAVVPPAVLMYLVYSAFKKRAQGKSAKKVLVSQLVGFVVLTVLVSCLTFSVAAANSTAATTAPATTATAQAPAAAGSSSLGLGLIAAAMVTSLAGIGGGIAVAAGAPAAIAATSEDPKNFGKSLIFVALGESIALYGVVISILILNKL